MHFSVKAGAAASAIPHNSSRLIKMRSMAHVENEIKGD